MGSHLPMLKACNVKVVVRICKCTYLPQPIKYANICFVDLPFDAQEVPSDEVVNEWLLVLRNVFQAKNQFTNIGLQSIAGFRGAYILIAIALIESGKDIGEVVNVIEKSFKCPFCTGIFNAKQIAWLNKYVKKNMPFFP